MFWKNHKFVDVFKQSDSHPQRTGVSRRATSLIPPAANASRETAQTGTVRFHELLVSLEAQQHTGCLRIISAKHKSRSALLLFKGRVLGALYGRKKLDYHCLDQDAHTMALADLASPGNTLDAYELPEELVLAAASLFNGEVMPPQHGSVQEMFQSSLQSLFNLNKPGCLVISNNDGEMVRMVYVFDGKIIGVFSSKHGWEAPTIEAAQNYLNESSALNMVASYLPLASIEDASRLGFSLTGLADVGKKSGWTSQQSEAVESFTRIRTETQTYSNIEHAYKQRRPGQKTTGEVVRHKANSALEPISSVPSHNTFAITP